MLPLVSHICSPGPCLGSMPLAMDRLAVLWRALLWRLAQLLVSLIIVVLERMVHLLGLSRGLELWKCNETETFEIRHAVASHIATSDMQCPLDATTFVLIAPHMEIET